ncbi:TetR/AcrR family transcriptional regulator [Neptuniibacter sp. QD72_48]|uniref:TetR/AcrR family transcriptional regulator n=1 Tax=Neptuniibacter sp. QD72_48 TaxID=3398214 RepID=UPI0039F4CC89
MKAGRHRNFYKDIALDQAMEVFWRNGYPGTSLSDLTTAMGINKPSLYSAFGNKEQLYKSALDNYVQKHGVIHAEHLIAVDKCLSDRIQCYLTSIAEMVTDPNLPGGCFVCVSTCELGSSCIPTDASQTIFKINEVTKHSLTEFFNKEMSEGNLTSERSPAMLANYILSLQFGLSVMARNGASLTELKEIIKVSTDQF